MKRLLILSLLVVCAKVHAEGYMLPKSFAIEKPTVQTPPPVTKISLVNLVRTLKCDYSSAFMSTLGTLVDKGITLLEYDSTKGQIKARLASGRDLFILLLPSKEKLTYMRITPADGRYDIPVDTINQLFNDIDQNL